MEPEAVDLSALDPGTDPARWEHMVASITAAAAPELARRAAGRSVIAVLGDWARPALAAGIVLAALAIAALAGAGRGAEQGLFAGSGVVEALSLDAPVSLWLLEGRAPTTDDLIMALEGELP